MHVKKLDFCDTVVTVSKALQRTSRPSQHLLVQSQQ